VLLLAGVNTARAQFGFGQFTPPPVKQNPVSGMLSLTPTTVHPREVGDLGPQVISFGQPMKPTEVNLNRVEGPAPAMPTKNQPAADSTLDSKPTGVWAPSPATNWTSIQRQPVTSILEKPPTPTGLGNASLNQEPDVDWRVVTPVEVPMVFVPLTASKPKPEPNRWDNPPATGPKTPKYQWK
jgi:hypothetical protein